MQQEVCPKELRKQHQDLEEEHAALKAELKRYKQLTFLTTTEDQERKMLQRRKLATKDQIVRIATALSTLDA